MSNGWTNHETWLAHLWLTNDCGTSELVHELVADNDVDDGSAAQALKDWTNEALVGPFQTESGLASDLLTGAFEAINWHEIAKALADEAAE